MDTGSNRPTVCCHWWLLSGSLVAIDSRRRIRTRQPFALKWRWLPWYLRETLAKVRVASHSQRIIQGTLRVPLKMHVIRRLLPVATKRQKGETLVYKQTRRVSGTWSSPPERARERSFSLPFCGRSVLPFFGLTFLLHPPPCAQLAILPPLPSSPPTSSAHQKARRTSRAERPISFLTRFLACQSRADCFFASVSRRERFRKKKQTNPKNNTQIGPTRRLFPDKLAPIQHPVAVEARPLPVGALGGVFAKSSGTC